MRLSSRVRRWASLVALWCCLGGLLLLWHSDAPPRSHAPARALLNALAFPSSTSTTAEPPPVSAPNTMTEEKAREEVRNSLPSLPIDFWERNKNAKDKFFERKDCAPLPSLYELEFHDTYWQTQRTNEGTFHLFGAYLDVRNTSRIGPAIRILAVHDRIKPKIVTHCQIWFEDSAPPVIVKTLEYKYVWNSKWGNYRDHLWQPYLVACVLPVSVQNKIPAAVSLVETACQRATNLLRVQHEPWPREQRHSFAVCVKGLDFLHEDLSLRLVEWIELLHLLGAHQVHMYQLQVHPNVSKVLAYYEKIGLVTLTKISLPGGAPNLPGLQHMFLKKKTTHKRQLELIPYNDCLYRHMYKYKWLALLDVDEVIVPLQDPDWSSLMERILPLSKDGAPRARTSYHASNVYYLDSLQPGGSEPGIPPHLHMMSHVWRTLNFTKPGQYVKAFHETDRVLALHNHFPLACLGGACSSYAMPTSIARLQHYRADCVTALSKTCADLRASPVRDTALWRWKERLEERVGVSLRQLGMYPT